MDIASRGRELARAALVGGLLLGLIENRTHTHGSKVHCLIYYCVPVLLSRRTM